MAAIYATLDPVQLLNAIRSGQQRLVEIADRPASGELLAPTAPTLEKFLAGLRTAWREGEVRPTSKLKEKAKRGRRRPDPLVVVTAQLREWFETEPWRTARELLERLQDEQPGTYPVGLLRTLQRRLKVWRRDKAHELVFGAMPNEIEPAPAPCTPLRNGVHAEVRRRPTKAFSNAPGLMAPSQLARQRDDETPQALGATKACRRRM